MSHPRPAEAIEASASAAAGSDGGQMLADVHNTPRAERNQAYANMTGGDTHSLHLNPANQVMDTSSFIGAGDNRNIQLTGQWVPRPPAESLRGPNNPSGTDRPGQDAPRPAPEAPKAPDKQDKEEDRQDKNDKSNEDDDADSDDDEENEGDKNKPEKDENSDEREGDDEPNEGDEDPDSQENDYNQYLTILMIMALLQQQLQQLQRRMQLPDKHGERQRQGMNFAPGFGTPDTRDPSTQDFGGRVFTQDDVNPARTEGGSRPPTTRPHRLLARSIWT